eukprot:GHRQ01028221.1.p1 GENE.GHRQ01028221.1~~GHRQ01028221.1.p1  ORF type:complete len:164 (+),score=56.56 GHRQ01028221.1:1087-1578(+)
MAQLPVPRRRSPELVTVHFTCCPWCSPGVAVSNDGINWLRGDASVEGLRGSAKDQDVGVVLRPNSDNWWTLDTCHLSVSDVQVLSNSSVSSGVGVYWMFYSGGDFEAVPAPAGLPGAAAAGGAVEGLRMRPGLAMSQVRQVGAHKQMSSNDFKLEKPIVGVSK